MITRKLQAEISRLMRDSPAVAILGSRQVGKTTLAKQIGAAQKKQSIYLDLENPLDVRRLADPFTFLNDNKDKLVIIDEVQTIPSLYSVLRAVIDADRKNGRFILLGSASPELVKGGDDTSTTSTTSTCRRGGIKKRRDGGRRGSGSGGDGCREV